LPDTYHSAGHGRGTATFKFYEGRDILNPSDSGAFMSPPSQAPKLSCSNPWRLNASYGRLRLDTLTATPDWSNGSGGG
jgi:hypothetical protein